MTYVNSYSNEIAIALWPIYLSCVICGTPLIIRNSILGRVKTCHKNFGTSVEPVSIDNMLRRVRHEQGIATKMAISSTGRVPTSPTTFQGFLSPVVYTKTMVGNVAVPLRPFYLNTLVPEAFHAPAVLKIVIGGKNKRKLTAVYESKTTKPKTKSVAFSPNTKKAKTKSKTKAKTTKKH
jgi:hypothetical protein